MNQIFVIALLGISVVLAKLGIAEEKLRFPPLPYEDRVHGRNSNAYNPAIGKPANEDERSAFLNKIKPYVLSAQKATQIPACAMGGMAVVESGFGFTRIAHFANNLFGRKVWDRQDTPESWQLKGQPDESQGTDCLTKTVQRS